MITSWDIYWITRLDILSWVFGFVSVISALLLLGVVVAYSIWINDRFWDTERPEHKTQRQKHWARCFKAALLIAVVCFIFTIFSIFTPTTIEAVAIYMLPKIANNEQVQKLSDNTLNFLNTQLEAWMKSLKPEVKK